MLGHVLASESAISVLGYVEEQSVTAAAESAAVIDGAVSRLRGAVDVVGSAVSAGASFVEPDALRRVLALATGSLQPSPPAVQVQLRVVGGSVKCDVCAGSIQGGGGDGGQPGDGGLGDGGRLGGAVQWVQEQKLGQQALAHGVALQRLGSGGQSPRRPFSGPSPRSPPCSGSTAAQCRRSVRTGSARSSTRKRAPSC